MNWWLCVLVVVVFVVVFSDLFWMDVEFGLLTRKRKSQPEPPQPKPEPLEIYAVHRADGICVAVSFCFDTAWAEVLLYPGGWIERVQADE